ncbi:hypothetical protein CIK06_14590 [Plantactinospora sp. KBS50]|nr:hypothetical protein CIK06_14590 [Plantactinospora sp. KBS50]
MLAGYLHLVMIAGVVAIGLGARLMVEDPLTRQPAALAALVAGPTLTLAGWIPLAALVHRRMSWHRLAGLLAIVIAAVLGHGMPLIANAAVLTALMLLTAHGDMLVHRRPGPDRAAPDVGGGTAGPAGPAG